MQNTQNSSKKFIVIGVIAGIVFFGVLIGLIGQGTVRHVDIFYPETVRQTVAFRDDGAMTTLVGISGIGGENNPTLITRLGFVYVLTVINDSASPHMLYIDGLDIQTELLAPGEKDIITCTPQSEGIYNYYDKQQELLLGQLKVVKVIQNDIIEANSK
ncbi:MAG: hypothetical protein WD154_07375 [Nitrosopumilaceae archaeon]